MNQQEPTQQFPVMQPQQRSGIPGWLMGCAIGCGILVIAMVVLAVFVGGMSYFAVRQVMELGKTEVIAEFDQRYDRYVENDMIPTEHQALYAELRELGTSEASSFPALLMCYVTLQTSLEDGQVTEQEARLVEDVRDFVKENPQAGWVRVISFVAEHPELQRAFDEAQYEFGGPMDDDALEDVDDAGA